MKFYIYANGDRSAGNGDHYAEVDIPYMAEDAEYVAFVKEQLKACFSTMFDARAYVVNEPIAVDDVARG